MRCVNHPFVFFHLKHHILFFANRILFAKIVNLLPLQKGQKQLNLISYFCPSSKIYFLNLILLSITTEHTLL